MQQATTPASPAMHYRSKTLATWLALLAGPLGLHRMYLNGLRDPWAWAHLPPTLAGLVGLSRIREFGQDDRLAWALLPVLGLMVALSCLTAIVYALTPDARWDARRNPGRETVATGWGPVLAAVAALMVGGIAFMGAVAYGGQKFFEWQIEADRAAAAPSGPQNSQRLTP
jgi:hypothetical protein